MVNVSLVNLSKFADATYGSLTAIEGGQDIPFPIERVYYIYDVPNGVRRGFHSHVDLNQILICVKGKVKILTKTPTEELITELSAPNEGLYIGPMVWREMYDFTEDAVLLVLANKHYDVKDYIRDYSIYEKMAREFFENGEKK